MDSLRPDDPSVIGGIKLHGRLGEGGMGAVYFGITAEDRQVAVKVIKKQYAGDAALRERFDREITAMGMVQGPRVASLVGAAEPGDEQPWLAMEYVRGLTLREYVEGHGPLAADMGAVLGEMLAEGLTAVHTAGLLHRDFKPTNIMLGPDGPKVIDFGLVALAETDVELTQTNQFIGTPPVTSPEQADSPRGLTSAADVYSFGATMIYALAKHYPYPQQSLMPLLLAIKDPDVQPSLDGVPPKLAPLIGAMVAYDASARPTLEAVAAQFRQICQAAGLHPREARVQFTRLTYVERPDDPPPAVDPPAPSVRRRREARVPSAAVQALAEGLCAAYERGPRL